MALNPFLGWEVAELQTALREAQNDLAAGSSLIGSGAGDVRSQSKTELSPIKRIEMILYALYLRDPDTYPLDQISRITQTRVTF